MASNGGAQKDKAPPFELQVPPESTPGVTQFSFAPSANCELLLTVPLEWMPGDHLRLWKDSSQKWQMELARGLLPAPEPKEVKFFIPSWAVLGESKLEVNVGGGLTISTLAPAFARLGDQMVFKYGSNGWAGSVMKQRLVRPTMPNMDCLRNMRSLRAPAMDQNVCCEELREAVEAAGGFFSPKLVRGALPPLHIPGVLAREAIEEHEVVCRIPRRLQITARSAQAIAPELAAELKALPNMQKTQRSEKALQGVLIAQLLHRAERRAEAAIHGKSDPLPDTLECGAIDPDVLRIWDSYADGLLSTDFSSHPYFRAANALEQLREEMEPSTQADFILDMAGEMHDMYTTISTKCSPELCGSALTDAKLLVQARLSMLSRCFHADGAPTLIPLGDLFNHMPEPGVNWAWDSNEDAMVYTACRPHAPGEEVFISYGSTCNVKLYQGYAFTLPPELETSWVIELRPERVNLINEVYLPESQWQQLINLDSKQLDDSLCIALNEVANNGQSPAEYLSLICVRCKAAYDAEPLMRPALEALKRARARRVGSSSWWQELESEHRSYASSVGMRVKMSEYLCLVAHLEAGSVWAGSIEQDQCLESAANLRSLIAQALQVLSEGHRLAMRGSPV